MIPLIIDSGAAGSIVSCQFLNDVGIAIDRPSTTLMINVNGERKRPLGEVLDFPITIQGVTIPINVVVTDDLTYSAIVGNDWLAKVHASIDYGTANMTIRWQERELEVPIEFLEMPADRRRRQEEKSNNEVEEVSEDEGEESEEEETEDEEEYEDEELEEKVFCYSTMEKKAAQQTKEESPVSLTCKFQDVVLSGIYTREDFMLVNEGVYLGGSFVTWDYLRRLDQRFRQRTPRSAKWVYDWKGPTSRCWCNDRLYSPSDSCYRCQGDLVNYVTLQNIPKRIIKELSTGQDEDERPWTTERRKEDVTPQAYNQIVLKKVARDQDRQNCFYCGRKSHLEWEERAEALPFIGHVELEEVGPTKSDQLAIGELDLTQREKLD